MISKYGGNVSHSKIPGAAPDRHSRLNYQPANLLLLIPLVGTLVPSFYNFTSPTLGGIPFFYWYQILWIPISVVFTWIVFRSTRGER